MFLSKRKKSSLIEATETIKTLQEQAKLLKEAKEREIALLKEDYERSIKIKDEKYNREIEEAKKTKDLELKEAKLELEKENAVLKHKVEFLEKAFSNMGFDVKDMKSMLNKLVDGIVSKNKIQVVK